MSSAKNGTHIGYQKGLPVPSLSGDCEVIPKKVWLLQPDWLDEGPILSTPKARPQAFPYLKEFLTLTLQDAVLVPSAGLHRCWNVG